MYALSRFAWSRGSSPCTVEERIVASIFVRTNHPRRFHSLGSVPVRLCGVYRVPGASSAAMLRIDAPATCAWCASRICVSDSQNAPGAFPPLEVAGGATGSGSAGRGVSHHVHRGVVELVKIACSPHAAQYAITSTPRSQGMA
jgi:hypothetical protein